MTNIVVSQLRMVIVALIGSAAAYFALKAFLDILFDQHAEITFLVLSASDFAMLLIAVRTILTQANSVWKNNPADNLGAE